MGGGEAGRAVTVHTSTTTVRADQVLVCTGIPFVDRGLFFARDRVRRPATGEPLAEGEGRVVRRGLRLTAESRSQGATRAVSGICPHLGGVVGWNPAEESWDCPLHGSRFDPRGSMLQGPAVDDLRPVDDDVPEPSDQG